MIQKARKKPVVIEFIQYTGNNMGEIFEWSGKNLREEMHEDFNGFITKFLFVPTLEGEHKASIGDYIIKGVKGEIYPCKPDIFEKTYDVLNKNLEK